MRDRQLGKLQDKLDTLPPVSHKILNIVHFRFDGKKPPSISKLHEAVGGNYNTVKNRYDELCDMGLIPD